MVDYREPPLLSGELTDYHRYLGYLLMSPAWKDIMKPKIAEKAKTLYDRLLEPSKDRKERLPDDYIRGQLSILKWMIEWPEKEMQLAANQIREQEIMSQAPKTE